ITAPHHIAASPAGRGRDVTRPCGRAHRPKRPEAPMTLKRLSGVVVLTVLLSSAASAAAAQSLVDSRLFQSPVVSTASADAIQLPAGSRVAVIDFRAIAQKSAAGKRVLTDLQAFQDKKSAELQAMQTQLQSLQSKRQTQSAVLAEPALA